MPGTLIAGNVFVPCLDRFALVGYKKIDPVTFLTCEGVVSGQVCACRLKKKIDPITFPTCEGVVSRQVCACGL